VPTYALNMAVVGAGGAAWTRAALVKAGLMLAAALAMAAGIVRKLARPYLAAVREHGRGGGAELLRQSAAPAPAVAVPAWRRQPGLRACSLNDVHEGLAVIAASVAVRAFGSGWPELLIAAGLLCPVPALGMAGGAQRMDGTAVPDHRRLSVCMERETRA